MKWLGNYLAITVVVLATAGVVAGMYHGANLIAASGDVAIAQVVHMAAAFVIVVGGAFAWGYYAPIYDERIQEQIRRL